MQRVPDDTQPADHVQLTPSNAIFARKHCALCAVNECILIYCMKVMRTPTEMK